MKLCKDCKHCAMPNPLANAYAGYPAYEVPMCGHPSAPRSPVDGSALATCSNARGEGLILRAETEVLDCGPDAKLFEQREPAVSILAPPTTEELARLQADIDIRSKQYKQHNQDSARILLMYGVCIALCIAALSTGYLTH